MNHICINSKYSPIRNSPNLIKIQRTVYTSAIHELQLKFLLLDIPNYFVPQKCFWPNSIKFDCVDILAQTFRIAVRFECLYRKRLNIDETPPHHVQ